jgi:hypothetical protein
VHIDTFLGGLCDKMGLKYACEGKINTKYLLNRNVFEFFKLAECYATLRVFKKNLKNIFLIFFLQFFVPTAFHVEFGVCLQKYWGSRPACLGGDIHRTNSGKRLSQIII